MSRLLVVVENYPQLKSDKTFQSLMDELAGTENRIAVARRDYNQVVQSFNTRVKSFPTSIIAGMFGFSQKEYFRAEEGAKRVHGSQVLILDASCSKVGRGGWGSLFKRIAAWLAIVGCVLLLAWPVAAAPKIPPVPTRDIYAQDYGDVLSRGDGKPDQPPEHGTAVSHPGANRSGDDTLAGRRSNRRIRAGPVPKMGDR